MPAGDLERGGSGGGLKNRTNDYLPPTSSYLSEILDTQWTSWLVPVFVVANVAVFIVLMYINNCPRNNSRLYGSCVARNLGRFSFEPWRENPLLGPSGDTLLKMGALRWSNIVEKHQAWRLVTCMWLHAGLLHLVVNMLSLVFIGIRLEQQFSFVRIGVIYLLSGIGGSVLASLFLRNGISVGASGAIFGLLGAMLSELLTNWTIYTNKAAALLTLVFVVVINLGVGILPHVNNFAHIGGFLTGFLLGFILLLRPQFGWLEQRHLPAGVRIRSKYKAYQYALLITSLILLVAGLTLGLAMLFRRVNGNDHCHWCHYVNCVPTSKWECSN